jgi:MtN3 and saliva related transmembrane protein
MFTSIEWLGLAAVVVSNCIVLPQLYRIIKSKRARDVSLGTLVIAVIAQVLWGTYGYYQSDLMLTLSAVFAFVIGVIVLYAYWYYEVKR